jgi:hypothetical protein
MAFILVLLWRVLAGAGLDLILEKNVPRGLLSITLISRPGINFHRVFRFIFRVNTIESYGVIAF